MAAIEVCSRILARDNEVTIRWVPAYSGSSGNDKHAQAAAMIEAPLEKMPGGCRDENFLPHDKSCHRGQVPRHRGVDLWTRESRAAVQAPFGARPPPPPAPRGKKDPRRPLLPAPIWPGGDRVPPPADKKDGHEQVPVVHQRRIPVATPPLHAASGMGPAGQEDVEGGREGV